MDANNIYIKKSDGLVRRSAGGDATNHEHKVAICRIIVMIIILFHPFILAYIICHHYEQIDHCIKSHLTILRNMAGWTKSLEIVSVDRFVIVH